jgi:hypothetical protein
MSLEMLMVILAVWTVTGLVAAIVFGHMVPRDDRDQSESQLATPSHNVKFFRHKKRIATVRQSSRNAIKRSSKHRNAAS